MIRKSTLGTMLLIAMIGAASPAFAQQTRFGARDPHGYVVDPPAARSNIFPFEAGGGSAGYNWNVEHDY
jgi:hypothetical protein